MSSESSPSDPPSCTPPDGASCWICLEEGTDDSGAPLVRDCSCRGHSGFAHLQCLIQYAESKSRDFVETGAHIRSDMFQEGFFEQCPNCKQPFQGDIRRDLTKAQLSFIEREFKEEHGWHLKALMKRILSLDGRVESNRIEAEEVIAKMLMMVEENGENCHLSCGNVTMTLASVYHSIGTFYIKSAVCLKKAKYYFEKSINILETSGDQDAQRLANLYYQSLTLFCEAEAERSGSGDSLPKKTESDLRMLRADFDRSIRSYGETDMDAMKLGVYFATELSMAFHTIEALRVLDKVVVNSRRVHGSSHELTKVATGWWKRLRVRYVYFEHQQYKALRYDNGANSCIIQGPFPPPNGHGEPRHLVDEKTFSVPYAAISCSCGTPVMLHGLKKAAHLNGEIGDVREYCDVSRRYVVHLEDKALKPVKVKLANLRIVFDLPDPKPKNLDLD